MMFHFILLLSLIPRNEVSSLIHDGCFTLKFMIVTAILVGTIWIKNSVFEEYATLAVEISAAFLLYQGFLMIITSLKINEVLVGNVDKEGDEWGVSHYILILATLGLLVTDITLMIYEFSWFGCTSNKVLMFISLTIVVLFFGLIFLRSRDDASILTSALLALYVLYLQWTAMASKDDDSCNPFNYSIANSVLNIIFGFIITVVCLFVIST
jgi:hypothetical protein